ncbi:MAG TPA: RimK-like ATPgrasp N-terminal domain-containing protein [Methanoregula sp.]|nr:RimK-like ATPgrasp N-terminal domain-containing protein [Methanoregula sp.]
MTTRRNGLARTTGAAAAGTMAPPAPAVRDSANAGQEKLFPDLPAVLRKTGGHREPGLLRDSLHILERDGILHVISEDYSYKTEAYYTILDHELHGRDIRPASSAVLDAYVVPMCLERAQRAGIPVAEWGISQGYVPLPALVYGLNYFATSADYFPVREEAKAKEVIAHVTNKGKYPFCYQKIAPDATVHSCVSIFGCTADSCAAVSGLAEKIYRLFAIPLVTMVFVKTRNEYRLSSLSPAKYSRISAEERALLNAYLAHQEFL